MNAFPSPNRFAKIYSLNTCILITILLLFVAGNSIAQSSAAIDLSKYVRIGRYDLPEPTRTPAPEKNLLAQEVSAITYNWDTQTLFVVGDGGTSVTQISKTGQLINTMTLAVGSSPQNTTFYDPEGITYIGNGQFVMMEERDRQAVLFTYAAGTTLVRAATKTVKLGNFQQNIGIEGMSFDPLTNGYVAVKEIEPMGIFQTGINFDLGTATNGSAETENSINLFNPALTNLLDFADVFALSNLPYLNNSPQFSNLLILSQESGRIINTDRSGKIFSTLNIVSDPGNPLTVSAQQHEGLTMDREGNIYVVSENGGGDFDHPQMWVYAPSLLPNQAPTAVTLLAAITSIPENTSMAAALKIADIAITDDGLGSNTLSTGGTDAAYFEILGSSLFIKAGTVLDFETKSVYQITINVDDSTIGNSPDASLNYTLSITDVLNESPVLSGIVVSEVAPWASGESPVNADWFELTNTGSSPIDITGWKMDDNSNSFASSVALSGIKSIAPGESVIFLETADPAVTIPLFINTWFGSTSPSTLQIGSYSGSGVGLNTGGDAVSIFNASGTLQSNISFGSSPSGPQYSTFNNAGGLNNVLINQRSVIRVNGAFTAVNAGREIGSPGTVGKIFISEVAPWSSGNSPVQADWFELTNTRANAVDISGWKMDDNSGSPAAAVALNGISSLPPGKSAVFIETATPETTIPLFIRTWFGSNPPADLLIGSYTGGGVSLGTGGDAVHVYNAAGRLETSVFFGVSPSGPFATFDNTAALNAVTISGLSVQGVNGAFAAAGNSNETGSPAVNIYGSFAPLPVTMGALKVAGVTDGVQVSWTAYGEQNISDYEIQRSQNGIDFTSVGRQKALSAGRSSINYLFTDSKPFPGSNFYRIKIMEKNGQTVLTSVVKIIFTKGEQSISAYPNPLKGRNVSVELKNINKGVYAIELISVRGELVFTKKIAHAGGSATEIISVPENLKAGIYRLVIRNEFIRQTHTLLLL